MTQHAHRLPLRVLLAVGLGLATMLGSTGCANLAHRAEIQTAARQALGDAGLTAGAEAFDTGEGLADRYTLLVCAVVPVGGDDDPRARAQTVMDVLNAVRDVTAGHEGRVVGVSVRLTDESTPQSGLDNWCRTDARILMLGSNVTDLVSVPVDFRGQKSAEFDVPYAVAELVSP